MVKVEEKASRLVFQTFFGTNTGNVKYQVDLFLSENPNLTVIDSEVLIGALFNRDNGLKSTTYCVVLWCRGETDDDIKQARRFQG